MKNLTYIEETAQSYFSQLETEASSVRNVFARVIEQAVYACPITFVGVFAKLNYIIKEKRIPGEVAAMIHQARKELFPTHNTSPATDNPQQHIKAAAMLVYYIFDRKTPIPNSLSEHFAPSDKAQTWGRFDENVLRVIVDEWNDDYIWATEEEKGSRLKICYSMIITYLLVREKAIGHILRRYWAKVAS